ncbi:cupin domain-containing protein [Mucilaginibacter terrenus]|uniref:Cupin domain-containing protein n=1 Tax=Mucilaginibacter terrenus TaxID=2482727 RepID=A0A3E2NYD7_9SPHI|nr:cupin domain-containing protein [Mucilaginibacter terrenus]RFZ86036.1 cupin domain-containing protein [Mucilaginibacter terrenus]
MNDQLNDSKDIGATPSSTISYEGQDIAPLSKKSSVHYKWGENCDGWTFVENDNMSVKQERMPPGTSETMHYHEKATQFFFMLKGTAIFTLDGTVKVLTEHEGIEVKPGQKHRITNHSEADIEFTLYSHPSTKNDRINVES